ncbi:MAG: glycosyltransferase [Desulfuromonadaceae bacterium]|nr:glycosyltransferase [Desulfuromonadaceae bacterium]
MKFRILHTEWSSGWGGQEQRIILECRKMMALGHFVIIACQPGSGILAAARREGIPAEEVIIRGGWDLAAVMNIRRLIRKHDITIVNTHSGKDTWVGGIAAKLAGAGFFRTRHLSLRVSNSPLNFIHRLADGIITTGEAIREELISHNRVAPDRVVSIATGVNVDRFNPETVEKNSRLAEELGVPPDCRVVTMVAVLRSMKRHDLLVEAAVQVRALCPSVRFLVVGDGPCREQTERLVRERALADIFVFTGHRSDIPAIFALSDVVVLTSDRNEGVPQSLSQAMAMARPVVASPIGSIPELVRDGVTGLLADPGSAASFAEQIVRLLNNDGLRLTLGLAARKHIVGHYTDDAMALATASFYAKKSRQRES